MADSLLQEARKAFHASILQNILRQDAAGIPSNADKHSRGSVLIAKGLISRLGVSATGARLVAQLSGKEFESVCCNFLNTVFPHLCHMRPGTWRITRGTAIADCEQYEHLAEIARLAQASHELSVSLGIDYFIKPDVVIVRSPEPDSTFNANEALVSEFEARQAPLRAVNQSKPILHACVSCKWTIRSDRVQNARSEAVSLIRNRKGKQPHVVVVTGEPLPGRIASIALGTGDVDCVYHVGLPELLESAAEAKQDDALDTLKMMVAGKRLRDISDLPLDLVI